MKMIREAITWGVTTPPYKKSRLKIYEMRGKAQENDGHIELGEQGILG
jgi:hypothetical protein